MSEWLEQIYIGEVDGVRCQVPPLDMVTGVWRRNL